MKDKVVIITGASSGIGKALAFAFGKEGAKIVITARHLDALTLVSNDLTSLGIDNMALVSDVSIEENNQIVVESTIKKYGKIDILINNAGISMRSLFEDLEDVDVMKQVMDVNFYGTVYATKFALPYIKQTKGSVVGISSIAGYRGLPVRAGYSASKFALNGFLEALRTELLKTGVHVLTACPGFTASNIRFAALDSAGNHTGESARDEAGMMTADKVAKKILSAVKKRKRQLILTPKGRWTVFLNKWLPGMTDKIIYKAMTKEKNSPLGK